MNGERKERDYQSANLALNGQRAIGHDDATNERKRRERNLDRTLPFPLPPSTEYANLSSHYRPQVGIHCTVPVTRILAAKMYRVSHLVVHLGWVDFKFLCSTTCQILLQMSGIWQKWLGSWATWWNIQIKVFQIQMHDQMILPVVLRDTFPREWLVALGVQAAG